MLEINCWFGSSGDWRYRSKASSRCHLHEPVWIRGWRSQLWSL